MQDNQYQTQTPAVQDLLSKVNRIYLQQKDFKDNDGKTVNYERLVIKVHIKDEPFTIEMKIDKKDRAMLLVADQEKQKSILDD